MNPKFLRGACGDAICMSGVENLGFLIGCLFFAQHMNRTQLNFFILLRLDVVVGRTQECLLRGVVEESMRYSGGDACCGMLIGCLTSYSMAEKKYVFRATSNTCIRAHFHSVFDSV